MTQPRGFTAAMQHVQVYADAALNDPEGVDLFFYTEKYGSVEACKKMARSFQCSFTSMRSRDRARRSVYRGDTDWRHMETPSPYDRLMCSTLPLKEGRGWYVMFRPMVAAMQDFEAVSRSTGKRLDIQDADTARAMQLAFRALNGGAKDVSREDRLWLHRFNGCVITDTAAFLEHMSGYADAVTELAGNSLGAEIVVPGQVGNPVEAARTPDWTDTVEDDPNFDPFA